MMDLIDRQAAIKALEETKQPDPFNRYEYQNIGIDWSIDAIMALPSAQPGEDIRAMCGECDAWNQYKNYPQPGWIPVAERLPIKSGVYLVCNAHGTVFTAMYLGSHWGTDGVIAWMKTPEPYKEGDHEPN